MAPGCATSINEGESVRSWMCWDLISAIHLDRPDATYLEILFPTKILFQYSSASTFPPADVIETHDAVNGQHVDACEKFLIA